MLYEGDERLSISRLVAEYPCDRAVKVDNVRRMHDRQLWWLIEWTFLVQFSNGQSR